MTTRLAALFLSTLTALTAAEVAPVISPAKRTEAIERARQALAPQDASAPETLKDPFYSGSFSATPAAPEAGANEVGSGAAHPSAAAPAAVARPAGARQPQELIEAIAHALRPSGVLVLRGEPVLIFGQKRVKAGESLTITFEGAEHAVVVTAIEPPNFTLRLNQAEFTRPIK